MNVIFHFPKTEQGIKELQNRVASIHSGAVNNYIKHLSCPKEQKLELIRAIQNANTDEKSG